jgi:hypothetical protein
MYDHEKRLGQRLEGKPFVLLGVNTYPNKAVAKRAAEKNGMSWRSWWDGPTIGSPISQQWGVNSFPRIFILDHKGVIRFQVTGMPQDLTVLDREVDKLLAEVEKEKPGAGRPAEPKAGEPKGPAAPKSAAPKGKEAPKGTEPPKADAPRSPPEPGKGKDKGDFKIL